MREIRERKTQFFALFDLVLWPQTTLTTWITHKHGDKIILVGIIQKFARLIIKQFCLKKDKTTHFLTSWNRTDVKVVSIENIVRLIISNAQNWVSVCHWMC